MLVYNGQTNTVLSCIHVGNGVKLYKNNKKDVLIFTKTIIIIMGNYCGKKRKWPGKESPVLDPYMKIAYGFFFSDLWSQMRHRCNNTITFCRIKPKSQVGSASCNWVPWTHFKDVDNMGFKIVLICFVFQFFCFFICLFCFICFPPRSYVFLLFYISVHYYYFLSIYVWNYGNINLRLL